MKQLIQFGLISSLLVSQSALAINPIQGFYGGIIAGMSHSNVSTYPLTFFPVGIPSFKGIVNNSSIGGGGGAALGYRIQRFRVEGEAFFNYISSGTLTLNGCTLESPAVTTPTGICDKDVGVNGLANRKQAGFNGSNTAAYGLVNVYYDFFSDDPESTIFPYIGVGIGGARLKKSVNFYANVFKTDTVPAPSIGGSVSASSPAAQGIIGIGFFLDDYVWASMDYRYLTTNTISRYEPTSTNTRTRTRMQHGLDTRYTLSTLNFSINFAFDDSSDS